jgi:hypothetical protein
MENNVTAAPAQYYFVSRLGGRVYTESPEEQGRGGGPRLLRIFRDRQQAKLYQEALEAYAGESLEVKASGLYEIQRSIKTRQGCRIAICQMKEGEWPRMVTEVSGRITLH